MTKNQMVGIFALTAGLSFPLMGAAASSSSGDLVFGTKQPPSSQKQNTSEDSKDKKDLRRTKPAEMRDKTNSPPPPTDTTLNFIQAVRVGNFEMAGLLLKNGANIDCRNCNRLGRVPLFDTYSHVWGKQPNNALVWLLERGANPDIPDQAGKTLLMEIDITNPFYSGIHDFLYLIEKGASVKSRDNAGNTVLHHVSAKAFGDPADMRDKGFGNSAFTSAEQWRRAFEKLIASGADINVTNKDAITPLMIVASTCNPAVVQRYLELGADPLVKNKNGDTALSRAIDRASKNSNKHCNRVVEILSSDRQSIRSDLPNQFEPRTLVTTNAEEIPMVWTGVFQAQSPRRGDADVQVNVFSKGNLIFRSSSGLEGNGQIAFDGEKVSASVKAKSPLNSQGKPLLGTTDVLFIVNGLVNNGIITGNYSSSVESGSFVLCNQEAKKANPSCGRAAAANPIGDLLKILRGNFGASSAPADNNGP